jgi:hypothetical protein
MLKLLCLVYMTLYDLQYTEWVINYFILSHFQFLTMFNTIVGAGAVGAGTASRYGSGSDQKMRLLAAPAAQHCSEMLV